MLTAKLNSRLNSKFDNKFSNKVENKIKKIKNEEEKKEKSSNSFGQHKIVENSEISKRFTLHIGDFSNDDIEIASLCEELSQATQNDTLEIKIASCGGSVFELNKIVNTAKSFFYKRIVTFIDSHAYSAGALIFLVGDTRIVYENSCSMFHDVALFVYGKHSDVKNETIFNQRYFDNLIKKELKDFFSNEEIEEMLNGKEFWLDAYEMCKRGIATHIFVFGELMEAAKYIEYMNDKSKKLKFLKEVEEDKFNLSSQDQARLKKELKELKESKEHKESKKEKKKKDENKKD